MIVKLVQMEPIAKRAMKLLISEYLIMQLKDAYLCQDILMMELTIQ
jgi:hypothetical protein